MIEPQRLNRKVAGGGLQIRTLGKNPFYAGKLVVGEWEVDCKGAFEPIAIARPFNRFKQFWQADDLLRLLIAAVILIFHYVFSFRAALASDL